MYIDNIYKKIINRNIFFDILSSNILVLDHINSIHITKLAYNSLHIIRCDTFSTNYGS